MTYPVGSDTPTTCAVPSAAPNTANCDDAVAERTVVGSYTGSPSPYGTFDQGGNVLEFNEAVVFGGGMRGVRGGCFDQGCDADWPAASFRDWIPEGLPHKQWWGFGSFPSPAEISSAQVSRCFGRMRGRRPALLGEARQIQQHAAADDPAYGS